MKPTLFFMLILSFAVAQSFEEQLSQAHASYVFNQDSSLIAAVNHGSINVYNTDTKDLELKLEPDIPWCKDALFLDDTLFALCGHMLYQWDLASQTLLFLL